MAITSYTCTLHSSSQCGNRSLFIPIWQSPPMYTCTVLLSVAIIAFSYKYGNHLLYMYSTSQCGNHCLFIPIWQSPPIHVHCTVLLSLRQSLSTFFDDNHCTFLLVATNCISPEAFTFLIYFLCGNHLSYLTGMTSSL